MKKTNLIKWLHITIITAGTLFLSIGLLNQTLWFDEAYTVGIVRQGMFKMLAISFFDVHPPLYYILLKLYSYIFGTQIVALRAFSLVCWVAFASLGYTHICRDFGKKVGVLFSAFAFLSMAAFRYATEIRMYSVAPFFVTLAAIYAWRYYSSGFLSKKNRLLFIVFSVLSAYSHHYGLITVGMINIMFLLYHLKINRTYNFKKDAKTQIYAYIPGLICTIWQSAHVAVGFWIEMRYPDFVLDIFAFFFNGEVSNTIKNKIIYTIIQYLCLVFIIALTYFSYRYIKKNNNAKAGKYAFYIMGMVLVFFLIVSLVRPMIINRYLCVLAGLYFFIIAFFLVELRKKILVFAVLAIFIFSIVIKINPVLETLTHPENQRLNEFVEQNFEEGDIVISANISTMPVIATQYQKYQCYFWNIEGWPIHNAYKAFEPYMSIADELLEIKPETRIWVMRENGYWDIINYYQDLYPNMKKTEFQEFIIPHTNNTYAFTLIELP